MALPVVGTTVTATANNASSITLPSMTVSGTDKMLLASASTNDDASNAVTGATWNTSESFTSIGSQSAGSYFAVDAWRLLAPTNTTSTVAISYGSTVDSIAASATLLTGVDQTTPIGNIQNSVNGTGTSISQTVTGATADTLIVDVVGVDGDGTATAFVPGASQTGIVDIITGGSYPQNLLVSHQDGADGGVMTFSWTNSDVYLGLAFAINGAGGGGGGATIPIFRHHHVQQGTA